MQDHHLSPTPLHQDGDKITPETDVTTLLSWHAEGRPYRKRTPEYFINGFLIILAIEIILFLFHEYLLMLVVFALGLLSMALAIVPPHVLYYRISTQGIRIEGNSYIWDELYDFYFMRRQGQDVIHVRTRDYFPGELTIVLGDVPISQVKSVLLKYLPFREYVDATFMEKAGDWLEKNFPLEKTSV